jgi:rare lipoprotein A
VPVVNKERTFSSAGIASWYGKKFHGQKTASGELYDMFAMTAAHTTFPIPSYARVTNVKTGHRSSVRITTAGRSIRPHHRPVLCRAPRRSASPRPGSGMVEVERVFEVARARARRDAAAPCRGRGRGDAVVSQEPRASGSSWAPSQAATAPSSSAST